MSDPPRPAQRRVPARIFTPSGWIAGDFHVAEEESLLAHLNGTKDFFTLTGVRLRGQSRALGFLALQRTAALLVVPGVDHRIPDPDPAQEQTERQVSCLLHGGVLMGRLLLPPPIRVSDHLVEPQSFIVVRDCTIGLDEPRGVEAAPMVVANAGQLVGVAEM